MAEEDSLTGGDLITIQYAPRHIALLSGRSAPLRPVSPRHFALLPGTSAPRPSDRHRHSQTEGFGFVLQREIWSGSVHARFLHAQTCAHLLRIQL
jgi:hypothetical protein